MRYLNLHRRVVSLVERFKLEHRPMPLEDPLRTNLNYLRGQHFTADDWRQPSFVPPYRLDGKERLQTPADLISQVVSKYRDDAPTLSEVGFWNLLYKELSAEAFSLVKDGLGYYTILSNWNAAAAIPWFLADFDPAAEYHMLNEGFQALPLTLREQFEALGGSVLCTHRLHRIDRTDPDGPIRLVFDSGDPDSFSRYRRVKNAVVFEARHVILAMPRRAIELLHPDSFLFESDQFTTDLRSVLAQPGLKIFVAYTEPWWTKSRNLTAGRSVTDQPIRQCFYWGTDASGPGSGGSILMASYNDGAAVEFWAGLARTPEYQPRVDLHPAPGGMEPVPKALRAPQGIVTELQRQLRELHGLAAIPDPYDTVYQDWTQDPYGGGWHFWKVGVKPEAVMRNMQRPLPNANVYVCGEAWSTQQGWVEGALETTDAVLERQLGLAPPP